jgi:hypothetical protein
MQSQQTPNPGSEPGFFTCRIAVAHIKTAFPHGWHLHSLVVPSFWASSRYGFENALVVRNDSALTCNRQRRRRLPALYGLAARPYFRQELMGSLRRTVVATMIQQSAVYLTAKVWVNAETLWA